MRLAIAVVILIAACGRDERPRAHAPVDAGGPAPREAADAGAHAAWIGVIASAEAVDVAPPFEGVIAQVPVRPGDEVAAGEVVALLDERPLREELSAARAALREARASARRAAVDVASAQHRVELEQRAVAEGTSPQVALDEARFAVQSAEAAAAQAKAAAAQAGARLERAESRLRDTAVRAPFAGTVGARYRDVGAATGPTAPIVRVIGGGELRLRFAVLAEDARRLAPGAKVVAEVETIDAPLRGTVERIAPEIDQPSQRVFVDAAIELDDATRLQPGLAARVRPAAPAAPAPAP